MLGQLCTNFLLSFTICLVPILSDAIFAWQISGKGLVKMFSIVFPILLAPLVILLIAHCHNLLKISKCYVRFHVLNCFSTTSCIMKMWSTVE